MCFEINGVRLTKDVVPIRKSTAKRSVDYLALEIFYFLTEGQK